MTAAKGRTARVAGFCLVLTATAGFYLLPRRPRPAEVIVYIGHVARSG